MQNGFKIISMNGLICPLTNTIENQNHYIFSSQRYANIKRNMMIFDTLPIYEPNSAQKSQIILPKLKPIHYQAQKVRKKRPNQSESYCDSSRNETKNQESTDRNINSSFIEQNDIIGRRHPLNSKIRHLKKINQRKKSIEDKMPKNNFESALSLKPLLQRDHLSSRDALAKSSSFKLEPLKKIKKEVKQKEIAAPPELKTQRYMRPVTPQALKHQKLSMKQNIADSTNHLYKLFSKQNKIKLKPRNKNLIFI